MEGLILVQPVHLGCQRRDTEAAPDGVRLPTLVQHGRRAPFADADIGLVADDKGGQRGFQIDAHLLGHGEGGGHDGAAGMGVAEEVVIFEAVAIAGVDVGGIDGGAFGGVVDDGRLAGGRCAKG